LPVITARTLGSRGVQNEVDTGGERREISRDVVALRGYGGVKSELKTLDGLAAVVASSLPVIAARTFGSRGVQDEVDAGVERGEVGLNGVTLRGNVRVKRELHRLDGLAAVIVNSLPEITARTRRCRGVHDKIDTVNECEVVGLDGVALRGNVGVKRELHRLDALAVVVARGLPVITAGTRRCRGVHDEVDAGVERGEIGLDGVTLGVNVGLKGELHLLDVLAAVVANSLPVIAARTWRSRRVHDEVGT